MSREHDIPGDRPGWDQGRDDYEQQQADLRNDCEAADSVMTLAQVKQHVAFEQSATKRIIAVQLAYNLGWLAAKNEHVADIAAQIVAMHTAVDEVVK